MNMKKETKKSGSWGGLCFWTLVIFFASLSLHDYSYIIAFKDTVFSVGEIWLLQSCFYFYDAIKQRNVTKKYLRQFLLTNGSIILLFYFVLEEIFIITILLPLAVLPVILVDIIKRLFK